MFTSIRSILVLFICFGCSTAPDINGSWFHYNGEQFDHSFWDISTTGKVTIQKADGQQLSYSLTNEDDKFTLISDSAADTVSLGSISLNTPSKIVFSYGSNLFRVPKVTSISKSKEEFTSYLTKRSVKIATEHSVDRLYFSNSLNHYGFKSVDILYNPPTHQVEINANWLLHKFNGHIAISFVQYNVHISTILIDSLSNQQAKGTFVFGSNALPVDLEFSEPYNSSSKSEEIPNVLSQFSWSGENSIQIVDTTSTTVYMEAIDNQSNLNFENISLADIEAVFKRNNTLTIRDNSPLNSFEKDFNYEISPDAKYLFVYERRNAAYSHVDSLNVTSSNLTLYAILPILYKDNGYINRTVQIKLRR